ncbi:cytochrome P450 6B6-like [Galleria mellonella]|uniref:unspecific monooxygenase n=1 Tax=Galleria mellonella TaxID=7137 RepID=A0A6J1WEW1_GALME|nr:cytochrome P450 6B6-like [Galleria mellonella]
MFFESILLNAIVSIILIVALIIDYVTKFFSYWYIRHIPYKSSIPFFGSDYHRVLGIRNTTQEVNKLYKKYPGEKFVGCIKSRMPDLIVREPDAIKKMLSTDFVNFHSRGLGLDKSQDVCLRNNLFYAEGEKWTLLRRGLESIMESLHCDFEHNLHDCLLGTNGDVNVQQLLSKVLDAVFKDLLLDSSSDTTVITNIRSAVQSRTLVDRVKSYLKNIFPSLYVLLGLTTLPEEPSNKTEKALEQSKLMEKIKSGSIFQLGIKEKGNRSVSDVEFAFSMLSLFVTEGYVPCHNLLTAILYELAKCPDVQQKVRYSEEYLDAAIKEVLRLHPPYSVITRQCVNTYSYDATLLIDKRITINIPVDALHKDKNYYNQPEVFNPDRFLDNSNVHSYAFLPFGTGPRKCVGEQLSLQIIRRITSIILNQYEIEPCATTPLTLPVTDHNFGRIIERDIWLNFKPIRT